MGIHGGSHGGLGSKPSAYRSGRPQLPMHSTALSGAPSGQLRVGTAVTCDENDGTVARTQTLVQQSAVSHIQTL